MDCEAARWWWCVDDAGDVDAVEVATKRTWIERKVNWTNDEVCECESSSKRIYKMKIQTKTTKTTTATTAYKNMCKMKKLVWFSFNTNNNKHLCILSAHTHTQFYTSWTSVCSRNLNSVHEMLFRYVYSYENNKSMLFCFCCNHIFVG